MSLAACMIVKNEENFIEDCLKSLQPVCNEIIIIDTGSTDKTMEIVSKYDCITGFFEWCNDFSAARNEAVKLAKSDWCLWIDADERIKPESVAEILEKTKDKAEVPTAYQCTLINYKQKGTSTTVNNFRLWANHHGVKFTGEIHEQIIPTLNKLENKQLKKSNILLDHWGYASDPETQQIKRDRNRVIMEKVLKENPNDYYIHYTMAQNEMLENRPYKALEHLVPVWENKPYSDPFMAAVANSMSSIYHDIGQLEKAYRFALESLILEPRQIIAFQLLTQFYHVNKMYNEAKWTLKHLLNMNNQLMNVGRFIIHDTVPSDEWIIDMFRNINHHIYWLQPGDIVMRANGDMIGVNDELDWQQLPQFQIKAKNEQIHKES